MAGEVVLVVDDDADIRAFATEALEEAGYEVIAVRDAAEGLVVLDALIVDLILLDHCTGPIPDDAFIRGARRAVTPMPIILWTAWRDAAARATAIGATASLAKPTDLDELLRRVRQELEPR